VLHRRFHVLGLVVDAEPVALRYADLVVARPDGTRDLDWECVAYATRVDPLAPGLHRVELRTLEERTFSGDAVLVRSVDGSHVLRGAGPLEGFDPVELARRGDLDA
jgi:hypothetical protein